MLAEKSTVPGIAALFSDDEDLLATFTGQVLAKSPAGVAINAFPKLNAKALLYKLSANAKDANNRIHAIDAVLRQWHEKYPSCKKTAWCWLSPPPSRCGIIAGKLWACCCPARRSAICR